MRLLPVIFGFGAVLLTASPGVSIAQPITPEILAAAEKEGGLTWYTASTLETGQAVIRGFEKKYPNIKVRMQYSGGERMIQRVSQEYASNIFDVDVLSGSELGQALHWKKQGWLTKFAPEDVTKHWPREFIDPDGMYSIRSLILIVVGYNSNLVKDEDAPKTWKDLLDSKWKGKLVKSHPGYSGGGLTHAKLIVRLYGWDYFSQMAKLDVMQLQSGGDLPRKLAVGERQIAVDTTEQSILNEAERGAPVKMIYPSDGVPVTLVPSGIMAKAKNPNAARVFLAFQMSEEGQQLQMDVGNARGFHPDVKPKHNQPPLGSLKLLIDTDTENMASSDQIKKDYQKYFTSNSR